MTLVFVMQCTRVGGSIDLNMFAVDCPDTQRKIPSLKKSFSCLDPRACIRNRHVQWLQSFEENSDSFLDNGPDCFLAKTEVECKRSERIAFCQKSETKEQGKFR